MVSRYFKTKACGLGTAGSHRSYHQSRLQAALCNLYTAGVTSVQANVWFYQSPPYCFKIGWLKGWVQFSPSSCWIHTRRFFKFRNWREHTPDNRLKTVDDIQEELAMLAFAIVLSQIWNSASCSFLLEDSPRFAFATMASVMITWFTFLYKCSFSHVGRYNDDVSHRGFQLAIVFPMWQTIACVLRHCCQGSRTLQDLVNIEHV